MGHKYFLLFFSFILLSLSGFAQTSDDDFVDGKIVNAAGDTVSVLVKEVKEHKYLRSVSVLTSGSNTPVKYTPKEISYFSFGEKEFVSTTIDGKKVFVERIIGGTVDLYLMITRERKGGKYVNTETFFIRKEDETAAVELTKANFRKEVGDRIRDYEELAQKVDNKYYTYTEKEAVIEDYNQWNKLGKPGTSWTKEAGNYTLEKEKEKIIKKPPYDRDRYGPRFGIEAKGMASYSFVSYSEELSVVGIFPSNGGFGYKTGLGFRAKITPSLAARIGTQFFNKRFIANFQATNDSGALFKGTEKGNINYLGMYAALEYEMGRFFVNGGLEFSFANWYSASYRITNSQGNVEYGDDNATQSFLAESFKNQVDFTFGFGYRIPVAKNKINLKPNFQYSMPLMPLWSNWVGALDILEAYDINVSSFVIELGLIIDIGF